MPNATQAGPPASPADLARSAMTESATLKHGMVRILAGTKILHDKAGALREHLMRQDLHGVEALVARNHTSLGQLVDEFERRIRALGGQMPREATEIAQLSSIGDGAEDPLGVTIEAIIDGHMQLSFDCRFVLVLLETGEDRPSVDLLVGAVACHDACAARLGELLRTGSDRLN